MSIPNAHTSEMFPENVENNIPNGVAGASKLLSDMALGQQQEFEQPDYDIENLGARLDNSMKRQDEERHGKENASNNKPGFIDKAGAKGMAAGQGMASTVTLGTLNDIITNQGRTDADYKFDQRKQPNKNLF